MMGFAPRIWDKGDTLASLRYLELTWRELEPERGVLQWAEIAHRYDLPTLRAQGIHLVLRFLCDRPGTAPHRDIPDWLYARTGDGRDYKCEYGYGYAPNYENPVFLAEHARLLHMLGETCGHDGFVAFVELGSLGHWGEWHIRQDAALPPMPGEALRDEYAIHYLDAFPDAKLLMRRPFRFAKAYGLGLYNDMTGEPQASKGWFDWLAHGGWYGMEPTALRPMPDFWRTAPAGGELTSALPMAVLLDSELPRTLALLRRTHLTFLGPLAPDPDFTAGYYAVLGCLGYRLHIMQVTLTGNKLTVTITNNGAAPFYWNWQVKVYLETAAGDTLATLPLPIFLPDLQPGTQQVATVALPSMAAAQQLTLGIVDPMTHQDTVHFATKAPVNAGRIYLLGPQDLLGLQTV